jgi:hypothetical protein
VQKYNLSPFNRAPIIPQETNIQKEELKEEKVVDNLDIKQEEQVIKKKKVRIIKN